MKTWTGMLSAAVAFGASVVWQGTALAKQTPGPPNVIVFLADDLGYADIGVQGQSKDVRTPNIDSIAQAGVRFTNGYVSCPVCSPTRAGLLTGRYQQRFGHEHNPGPDAPENFGLPKDQVTIAEAMKQRGYKTGLIGKWHLGEGKGLVPQDRGFEEFYGFLGGAHQFTGNEKGPAQRSILRGGTAVGETEYLTDAIGREAVAFVDRHASEPFFAYVAFNDVHAPLQAPEKYLKRFAAETDPKRQQLLAKLSALDDAVGLVLKELREKKLEDNTLIFFLSDNGGPTAQNGSRNAPFSGFKSGVQEGGIRVPFMVQWKSRLPQGKVLDQPVISLDIFPTVLAASGGTIPPDAKLDGRSLLPLLSGETNSPTHDALFWRFGEQWAVRAGNLKLSHHSGQTALFDLSTDPAETKDLSASQPADVQRLTEQYAAWNKDNVAPLWGRSANPQRQQRREERRGNRASPQLVPGEGSSNNLK